MTATAVREQVEDSDGALLAHAAIGDEDAFALLVRRYQARFYRVARRMLGDDRDAEDAVQIAFFRVYRNAASYRDEWSGSTWLYRVLTNVCIDQCRKRRRAGEIAEPDAERPAPLRGADRLDVERALAKLPAEARAIFLLRYAEELSYAEVARARGISVNTVKTQLRRAKRKLRIQLSE